MADSSSHSTHPQVAIIVAARNEEASIRDLLATLSAQNYPHDKMEVLLGDDASTDATGEILERWAKHFPLARVVHVTDRLPGLVGKANVLAQLCRLTQAPYLLFTDADCRLPDTWVGAMVRHLQSQVADPLQDAHIATGFTFARGNGPFDLLQATDWTAALSVIHFLSVLRIPVTAMGNNMACTTAAYYRSGGFEQIQGSITEDYSFFRNILQVGGTFSHLASPEILIETRPQSSYSAWMAQRKRWLTGAFQLPWHTQLPFWAQLAWLPMLVVLGLLAGWQTAALVWVVKVAVQSLLIGFYMIHLRLGRLLFWLLPYDLFSSVTSWLMLVEYTQNRRVIWKGIAYSGDQ